MKRGRSRTREEWMRHGRIVLLMVEILLILVYYQAEVEPFVYVHF